MNQVLAQAKGTENVFVFHEFCQLATCESLKLVPLKEDSFRLVELQYEWRNNKLKDESPDSVGHYYEKLAMHAGGEFRNFYPYCEKGDRLCLLLLNRVGIDKENKENIVTFSFDEIAACFSLGEKGNRFACLSRETSSKSGVLPAMRWLHHHLDLTRSIPPRKMEKICPVRKLTAKLLVFLVVVIAAVYVGFKYDWLRAVARYLGL